MLCFGRLGWPVEVVFTLLAVALTAATVGLRRCFARGNGEQ